MAEPIRLKIGWEVAKHQEKGIAYFLSRNIHGNYTYIGEAELALTTGN